MNIHLTHDFFVPPGLFVIECFLIVGTLVFGQIMFSYLIKDYLSERRNKIDQIIDEPVQKEQDFEISMLKDDMKKMQQEMDQMRNDACRDRMHTKNIIEKTLAKVDELSSDVNGIKADIGDWCEKRDMESGIHNTATIVDSICDIESTIIDLDYIYESIHEIRESLKITDDDVFKEIPKQYDELRSEMFELRDECINGEKRLIKLMQLLMESREARR